MGQKQPPALPLTIGAAVGPAVPPAGSTRSVHDSQLLCTLSPPRKCAHLTHSCAAAPPWTSSCNVHSSQFWNCTHCGVHIAHSLLCISLCYMCSVLSSYLTICAHVYIWLCTLCTLCAHALCRAGAAAASPAGWLAGWWGLQAFTKLSCHHPNLFRFWTLLCFKSLERWS